MKLLQFVKKLHDKCIELAGRLTFNKSFSQDGMVVCLYGTLLELTGSFVALADSKKKAGMSPVFRSFLEGYVDFKNISNDPSYINFAYAMHHKLWVKALTASKENNPFLQGIAEYKERDSELKRHETELQKLRDKEFRPLQVHERFERAGMQTEYKSIYNFISGEVHNGIGALTGRHLERKENDFDLVIYSDFRIGECAAQLDTIAELLLKATNQLHRRLDSKCEKELEQLDKEFATARAE